MEAKMDSAGSYDLKSVKMPKLTGTTLSLFAWALENNLLKSVIMPGVLKSAGLEEFRALSAGELPTSFPIASTGKEAVPGKGVDPSILNNIEGSAGSTVPYRSARDYAQAYKEGKTDPEKVALKALDAIRQADSGELKLRPFITVDKDDVIQQASKSAGRWKAGKPLSVLDGVPITAKDQLDMVPYPTTVGTRFFGKVPASQDATIVARLRAAGALMIGKANLPELVAHATGLNLNYGSTRNPFNPEYDTGGSSSGSATAVSAGICAIALSTDGGGSSRIPAAFCGVVGLKPSHGRISDFGYFSTCPSVATAGLIAATIEDVAIAYACVAGQDIKDDTSLHQPTPTLENWNKDDLKGIRLGVFRPWFEHASTEIVKTCNDLMEKLTGAGAEVKEIVIPGLDIMRITQVITMLGEMAATMRKYPANFKGLRPATRIGLSMGREFEIRDYIKTQRMRTHYMKLFSDLFSQVDAIVTPATAITAPQVSLKDASAGWLDLSSATEIMRFAFPANVAGLPAICFPAGYNNAGLPIGMQAMGRWWDEALLLRIAFNAEKVVERKRPVKYFDLI
jgi:Asp-tRNA(Asn)/Glu-tRNA(Gln) amidotransferase A subunit family amidase